MGDIGSWQQTFVHQTSLHLYSYSCIHRYAFDVHPRRVWQQNIYAQGPFPYFLSLFLILIFPPNRKQRRTGESRSPHIQARALTSNLRYGHVLIKNGCTVITARFSPDDKFSRHRVTIKKRYGVLLTQLPARPM